MFVIEDGVKVTLKQTKDGLVLVIGDTVQPVAESEPVVVPKWKRKSLKVSGGRQMTDAQGNQKWLNMGERISKSTGHPYIYMKKNPAYNSGVAPEVEAVKVTVVEPESNLAKLGQNEG